jgi:lipoyl(octanoyl) transferase
MREDAAVTGATEDVLQVYLLGVVEFDAVLRLQRRLVYEIAGDRNAAALIICEHPPLITVGRDGSREHIGHETDDLETRGWPVRWVNRGGGCLIHTAGQVAAYPILALDRRQFDLRGYLEKLQGVVIDTLSVFEVAGITKPDKPGVYVQDRLIGHIGVAVRDWIAYFGIALNVNPDLEPFRRVRCAGPNEPSMTSLERERRSQVRTGAVRQQLLESFSERFGFVRTIPFHSHPALADAAPAHAAAVRNA